MCTNIQMTEGQGLRGKTKGHQHGFINSPTHVSYNTVNKSWAGSCDLLHSEYSIESYDLIKRQLIYLKAKEVPNGKISEIFLKSKFKT